MFWEILFPCCDPGWYEGLQECRTACRFKVTMLQYYSYCLVNRSSFSAIHHGSKLFQQYMYMVNAYVKTEGLDWVGHNQGQLRLDQYCGLSI